MSFQRQDYLLRMIGELRQFVSTVVSAGGPGRAAEALHAIMHAQQQLFQIPPEKITNLTLDEQLDTLSRGERPTGAVEKVIAHATILGEAARIYEGTDRLALARSSRQLALAALLTAAARWPEQRALVAPSIAAQRDGIDDETPAPVRELLSVYDQSA